MADPDRDGPPQVNPHISHPSRYRVGAPRAYAKCSPAAGQAPATHPSSVAVLVVHGMGQQIEFETLDLVEQGLRRVAQGPAVANRPVGQVRFVRLADTPLRRLEMKLSKSGEGGWQREVHLYEAYWAPLTEGRVTLRDVIRFFSTATGNAFSQRKKRFERWLFDQMIEFRPDKGTVWTFVLATLAVLFFIWMNTAAAICAGWALWEGPRAASALLSDLTWIIQWPVGSALLFGLALWLASVLKGRRSLFRSSWNKVVYAALASTVLAMAAAAVLSTFVFLRHGVGDGETFLPGPYPSLVGSVRYLVVVLSWIAFVGGVLQVRKILVQYVGDVAAYISPSVLDRFAAVRREIKDTVGAVARAVYESAAADGRSWQYDRVILVGHSLGSLIAYDALDRLINEDALEGDKQQIVSRTALFLTLGSPLDKTAFLFARQGKRTSEAREALAGTVQPMIQSYARRPRRWINVWSPHDPVSGELDFYDDEKQGSAESKWVENRRDPEATVPLLAHVQYWDDGEVYRILHASIVE